MKKKSFSLFLTLALSASLAMGVCPMGVMAEDKAAATPTPTEAPVKLSYKVAQSSTKEALPGNAKAADLARKNYYAGSNQGKHNYASWAADTERSALVADGDGYMRFQADAAYNEKFKSYDGYLVEYYDKSFNYVKGALIKTELPVFGAFYAADDAYYILSGQNNEKDSDDVEVFRVTKYDRNWNRVGACSLKGVGTRTPFVSEKSGSGNVARMALEGNTLAVVAGREIYGVSVSENGITESSLTFTVNTNNMKLIGANAQTDGPKFGNTPDLTDAYLTLDKGTIVAVEGSTSYPRGAVLLKYAKSGDKISSEYETSVMILMDFAGKAKDPSQTGVSLGGLVRTNNNYLLVGSSTNTKDEENKTRNIFVRTVPRDGGMQTLTRLTESREGETSYSNPQLVSVGDGHYLVLWTEEADGMPVDADEDKDQKKVRVYYQMIDETGNMVGDRHTMEGALSDCQPIVQNNKVSWYVWNNGEVVFYSIDLKDRDLKGASTSTTVRAFKDVTDPAQYYYVPVYWALDKGITSGVSESEFGVQRSCTRAQIVSFLWRAFGSKKVEETTSFSDVKSTDYYYDAVNWAVANGITSGTGHGKFSPNTACTRAQAVTFLWRATGSKTGYKLEGFEDVREMDYYAQAVAWASATGVTSGTDKTHFSPRKECTRGQIVTFLYNAMSKEV